MKKLLLVILAMLMMLCVCAYAEDTEQNGIPSVFIGFDDGVVPSNFKPNAGLVLMENDTSFVNDGIFRAVGTSDPYAVYDMEYFYDDYSEIVIRMKHDSTGYPKSYTQVFFKGILASGDAFGFHGSYQISQTIGEVSDGYKTYVLKLSDLPSLEGAKITSTRFDLLGYSGDLYLDYIKFVPKTENADIIYTFDGGYTPWGKNAGIDALTVSDGVLSGTNTANNGLIANSSHKFLGAVYPKVYVRMMIDKAEVGEDGVNGISGTKKSLMYTNLVNSDGETIKSLYGSTEGYSYASTTLSEADNGNYKVYTYDFSGYEVYLNNYVTSIAYNIIEGTGARFNVDTILFKNSELLEWNFEVDGLFEGWSVSDSDFTVSDGKLKYTNSSGSFANPRFTMSNLAINANSYTGLEVVMKHEVTSDKEKSDIRLYYTGTAADGSAIALGETHTTKQYYAGKSSGDNFVYYYLDLENATNWAGSTINYLRIDPINELGNVEIESIRFVPAKMQNPLDETLMSISYDFENEEKGHADGTITVNFGGQDASFAKRINLFWASGNSTDGFTQLSDYTNIKSDSGANFALPIKIDKDLLIPFEATALVARVTDSVKTFDVVFELPQEKLPEDLGEPLYTASFASDFHLGGWGSNPNPNVKQAAARSEIMASEADFLVVSGDICQWYGQISKSDEWRFATEYFKEFDIPVYMVKGNHDEPNYPSGYVKGEGYKNFSYDFFDGFLYNWLEYSEENDIYTVDRIPGKDYYHTTINGHHYIFLAVPEEGNYAFGDEQLEWFESILYQNEESGKPIFVFGHVPANGKLNYQINSTKGGITDFDKFEAILNKHPTAIYTSGDSHYTLETFLPNVINGKQEAPSYVNDGAVIEAVISTNEAVPGSSVTAISGTHSMGLIAEIYEDRVVYRARDFINQKWISIGLSHVTFKDKCPIEVFTVKDENGVLSVENPVEGLTYTWYLNGEETCTGESVTLTEDFCGFVAVRAVDAEGNYRSELIDTYEAEYPLVAALRITDSVISVDSLPSQGNMFVASYSGTRLIDSKVIPVTEAMEITIEETGLNTEGAVLVKAFFFDKQLLKPLGFSALKYIG